MILVKYAAMRARLFTNGTEISANPFVGRFLGAVCSGIASSLKAPRAHKNIVLELRGDNVALQVDSLPVDLDRSQGFAGILVRDTVQGMIRNLKGVDTRGEVRIVVDIGEES